jgi:hypothetical protein
MGSVAHAPADTALMLPTLTPRRPRRTSTLGGLTSRIEVCPPTRGLVADSWWGRLNAWLLGDAPLASAEDDGARLAAVKLEFARCLDDVDAPQAGAVLMRINTARTLHELWHVRAGLYGAIALEFSQTEAERRLAPLARHFPTRTPRSAPVPLDG